ncbi:MAG TPA: hypothetical protein VF576_13065, partial [Rubricoccaceae bacterium]
FARRTVVFYVAGGLYNANTGQFTVNELGDTFDPDHAYSIDRLREIARSHPTVAAEAVDRWLAAMALGQDRDAIPNIGVVRPSATTRAERFTQDPSQQDLAAVSAFAGRALPLLVPPLDQVPPAVTSALVTPSVCLDGLPGRDAFAAVLSYTSAEPGPVRVLYGWRNRLVGPWRGSAVEVPLPPEVFFPGGPSDPAPGRQTRVALRPGEAVTWTLLGRTVTASAATARCPHPEVH